MTPLPFLPPPPPENATRPPLFTGRPRAHRAWGISAIGITCFLGTGTGLLSRGELEAVFVPQWNRWLIADAICYSMFFSGPVLRYTFLLTQRLCQCPALPDPLSVLKHAFLLLWETPSLRWGMCLILSLATLFLPTLHQQSFITFLSTAGLFLIAIPLSGLIILAILQGVRLNDEVWHEDDL